MISGAAHAVGGGYNIVAYIALPALGILIGWLTYKRTRKTGNLTDALTTVQLWESETTALKARLESVERQNREQAAQIEHLLATNKLLTEQVTNAAAVSKLAQLVVAHHEEVMAALRRSA